MANFMILLCFRAYLSGAMMDLYDNSEFFKLLLSYDLDKGPNGNWVTETMYDNTINIECNCKLKIIIKLTYIYHFF